MTRELFDQAIADFDHRVDLAVSSGDFEAVEALYLEAIEALDGEEPTDEEVVL
jgi:hypothetical protein